MKNLMHHNASLNRIESNHLNHNLIDHEGSTNAQVVCATFCACKPLHPNPPWPIFFLLPSPRRSSRDRDAGLQKNDPHPEREPLPHLQHHQRQRGHQAAVGDPAWLGETPLPSLCCVLCYWWRTEVNSPCLLVESFLCRVVWGHCNVSIG